MNILVLIFHHRLAITILLHTWQLNRLENGEIENSVHVWLTDFACNLGSRTSHTTSMDGIDTDHTHPKIGFWIEVHAPCPLGVQGLNGFVWGERPWKAELIQVRRWAIFMDINIHMRTYYSTQAEIQPHTWCISRGLRWDQHDSFWHPGAHQKDKNTAIFHAPRHEIESDRAIIQVGESTYIELKRLSI